MPIQQYEDLRFKVKVKVCLIFKQLLHSKVFLSVFGYNLVVVGGLWANTDTGLLVRWI